MQHYCTLNDVRFDRNVMVATVFPEEKNNDLVNKKEFDGVLYEKGIPKVVFEINGREHANVKKRIGSDLIKMELLKSKEIQLIVIPNNYVKHYEFIRELLIKFKKGVYKKSLFEEYDS